MGEVVRFTLPAGYSLGTHGRGYVFTIIRRDGQFSGKVACVVFADAATRSPFPTPGAAVRAIIEDAGLVGEARDVLLAEVARLPESLR